MVVFTQQVIIGGVDVSNVILNWRVIKDKANNGNTKSLIVLTTDVFNLVTVDNAVSVTVSKGDDPSTLTKLFSGEIENWTYGNGTVMLDCRDSFWLLNKRILTKSYQKNIDPSAGVISGSNSIFEDLIEVQAGLSTISVDSGTTDILDEFICNDDFIRERAITLARYLNWQIYWDDENEVVRLEPEGTNSYDNNLTVGNNIQNIPRWTKDLSQMINKLKIKGAVRRDTKIETFDGDASEDSFELQFTPKDTEIFVDSVLQVRGVSEANQVFDYTVNEDTKSIVFESGSIPGVGVDNVEIRFTADVPIPVIVRNQSSIDQFRQQDSVKEFDDIRTINDATAKGRRIIDSIGTPFNSTLINTVGEYGLKVGMKVRVIDVQQGRDLQLTIQRITYQFPEGFDICEVGDKSLRIGDLLSSFSERLREVEKGKLDNQDILNQVFDFVRPLSVENRYFKSQKQDFSGQGADIFVLDSPDFGILGTNELGDNAVAKTEVFLVQGDNTYKEFFYDTDFEGTGTATWNTSTQALEFISGQDHTTAPITLGTAYNFFSLSFGTLTGDITIEFSADNGVTYQTVTTDVRTAVNVSDTTSVLLRFTESSGGVASIAVEKDAISGEVLSSGITMVLEE